MDSPFFHGLTFYFRGAPHTDKGYVELKFLKF